MASVSQEQIDQAKRWDLLSYLQRYEPDELVKSGAREYRTKSYHSLVISNGKWNWESGGFGGKDALTYLIKVRDMKFTEAVELLGGKGLPPPVISGPAAPPRPFALPEGYRYATYVVSYLQKRGIDPEIIGMCIRYGILYESRNHHNCVFVGRDTAGKPRFACMRGTIGDFKLDAAGSDKRYSFCFPAKDETCTRVSVSEAPIDALSVATLRKCGGADWRDCYYLSLGGTVSRALEQFLKDHPNVRDVFVCMDNDRAGLEGMKRIETLLADYPRPVSFHPCPPPKTFGKDYNEMLTTKIAEVKKNRAIQKRLPVR